MQAQEVDFEFINLLDQKNVCQINECQKILLLGLRRSSRNPINKLKISFDVVYIESIEANS